MADSPFTILGAELRLRHEADPDDPVVASFRELISATWDLTLTTINAHRELLTLLTGFRWPRGWHGHGAPPLWFPGAAVTLTGPWPRSQPTAGRARKRPGRPRWHRG